MSNIENDDPAEIVHRIRGANGQTANLFVVETYAGTDKFVVDSDGDVTVTGNLKPAKIHGIRYIGDYGFPSLSAALTDQGESAGGAIFVPAGTFVMPNTALTIRPKTKILGAGENISILNWADATANHGLDIPAPVSGTLLDIDIRDLKLTASIAKTGRAINHSWGTRTRIERLWIESWGGEAFYVSGSPNSAFYSSIKDCRLNMCKHGIYMTADVRTWDIQDNCVDKMYGTTYPSYGGKGIFVSSGYNTLVLRNTVEHCYDGVHLMGGPSASVLSNYFEENTTSIQLSNNQGNTTVRGNYSYSDTYGMLLSSARYCDIVNNQSDYAQYMYTTGDLAGTRAHGNKATDGAANTPWTFNSITVEPSSFEATWLGTGSLAPKIVRGTSMAKYVEQATQPTLTLDGEMQFWRDTDDSKVYLICRINGADKKVELT